MVATDGCKLREKERKSELLTTICVCLSSIPARISALCSTKQDQVWQSNYLLGRFYLEDHSILLHICFVWWCIMGCKFCAIQWDFAYIHVLFYFQYRCVNSSLAFPYKIFVCENFMQTSFKHTNIKNADRRSAFLLLLLLWKHDCKFWIYSTTYLWCHLSEGNTTHTIEASPDEVHM